MSYDNKLELQIVIDAETGNAVIKDTEANLKAFAAAAAAAGNKSSEGFKGFGSGTKQANEEMRQATQTAQLLAGRLGIDLPRSIASWLSGLKGVAPALSTAFSAVAIVGLGIALFEAGKRLYEWISGSKEAEEQAKKLQEAQDELNKSFEKHLEIQKGIREERARFSKTGSALTDQERTEIQETIEGLKRKKQAVIDYIVELNKAVAKPISPLAAPLGTVLGLAMPAAGAQAAVEATKVTQRTAAELQLLRQRLTELGLTIDDAEGKLGNLNIKLGLEKADEGKKRLDEINKKLREGIQQTEAFLNAFGALKEVPAAIGGLIPGLMQALPEGRDPRAYFDDLFKGYLKTGGEAIAATDALRKANDDLAAAIARRGATHEQILAMELAALEQQRAQYGINAEAIAAIEEREKLLVMQYHQEMATDARNQFEKTAATIEGFFDRVFLSAKSFTDVWKQLLSQIVSYALKQFSRIAAGWLSSWLGSLQSISGSLGKIGGMFGAGAAGSAGGAGGYNLNQLPGWGGSTGSASSAGSSWFGMSGNYGAIGRTGAALGGSSLINYGLSHRGFTGDLSLMGGGAAMGASYGGPLGAMIGGAAGSTIAGWRRGGTLGFFEMGLSVELSLARKLFYHWYKSAETKLRTGIKSQYSVDISQPEILKQLVAVAKQNYGGDIKKAIAGQEIRDLVELYAMSTGQATKGMPAKMTAGNLVQSGGGLFNAGSYGSPAALPGSGLGLGKVGGSAPTVINITVPGAKEFFEHETVTVIANNGRIVQKAGMAATKSNFGRRELTALQVSPATIVS